MGSTELLMQREREMAPSVKAAYTSSWLSVADSGRCAP